MAKTSIISTRVDPDLKAKVENILTQLGLSTTQAITSFLRQVELQNGLPFQVKIPNETTSKAIDESKQFEKLARLENPNDLYKDIDI